MWYLIISVLSSVLVSVFLKLARGNQIKIEQAILMNYGVVSLCVIFFLKPDLQQFSSVMDHWPIFLSLGVLLPSVFVIMGRAVREVGIAKSDVAQRLSLFLSVLAAFLLFGEAFTWGKGIGIILAFLALFLLTFETKVPDQPGENLQQKMHSPAVLLGGVLLGYGVIDILFKQLSKTGQAFSQILLVAFVLAGILMLIYLCVKKTEWHKKSLLSGLILGGLNFSNILFYIRAHQAFKDDPTLVFVGMNLGVIILGTILGIWVFREKALRWNIVGIGLAILSIVCLFYGPLLSL